jgi:hypothetical protein
MNEFLVAWGTILFILWFVVAGVIGRQIAWSGLAVLITGSALLAYVITGHYELIR